MSDAKKCDVTGEIYSVEEAEEQDVRLYRILPNGDGERIDVSPKILEKIKAVLERKAPEKKEKKRKKYNVTPERRKELAAKNRERIERAQQIREDNPSLSWQESLKKASAKIADEQVRKDEEYMENVRAEEDKDRPKPPSDNPNDWEAKCSI